MPATLPEIRASGEAELNAILAKLDARAKRQLRTAIRQYGSVRDIPQGFWDDLARDAEEETVTALLLLMLAADTWTLGRIRDQTGRNLRLSNARGAAYGIDAARRAERMARQTIATTRDRLARELQNRQLDRSRTGLGQVDDRDIDDAIDDVLTPERRGTTATNETTGSISRGQMGAGTRANEFGADVDLVWVTEGDSLVCERCSPLNGTTEDVWGQVFRDGPGEEAHPNCVLPDTRIVCLGAANAFMDSVYDGMAVEVVFASGSRLSVTENHRVLTCRGWVKAKLLTLADYCCRTLDVERMAAFINPDADNSPALANEFAAAWDVSRFVSAPGVPVAAKDFDGDGACMNGKVDVVLLNRELRFGSHTQVRKQLPQLGLQGRNDMRRGSGAQPLLADCDNAAPCCVMCGCDLPYAGARAHARPFNPLGVGMPAKLDAIFSQDAAEHRAPHTARLGQLIDRFSGQVAFDRVVQVRYFYFAGHVYDFSVPSTQAFTANGIVTHNCRCSLEPRARAQVAVAESLRAA